MPAAGDLAAPDALAQALKVRASASGEIIFMLTDEHHLRLAINLLLNLEELRLHHHLVIASSADVCDAIWARAQKIGLSLGCGHSSFLHRGQSARIDAGLHAYGIQDGHVYHLWWQRWFFLSEAVGLGYRVLSLDTDVSLRADPYPLLHGPLAHHDLITGLDNDQALRPFYFPAANVGFAYARGGKTGGAYWVLRECRVRLERLLIGQIVPLPGRIGLSQQVCLPPSSPPLWCTALPSTPPLGGGCLFLVAAFLTTPWASRCRLSGTRTRSRTCSRRPHSHPAGRRIGTRRATAWRGT